MRQKRRPTRMWMSRGPCPGRPSGGQGLEVVVADDQVVGDAEDGGAERAVAVADQRAVGFVYLVTLVTGRSQAGAAGDGAWRWRSVRWVPSRRRSRRR